MPKIFYNKKFFFLGRILILKWELTKNTNPFLREIHHFVVSGISVFKLYIRLTRIFLIASYAYFSLFFLVINFSLLLLYVSDA